MFEEIRSEEFRLINIDETRNFMIEKINQNELMSKKHKKVCTTLNYIQQLYSSNYNYQIISISAFASLAGIPIGITRSGIGLKICAITAGIKKYKSIIKKKKKEHDKIVLLAKSNQHRISKTLIDSVNSHDEVALRNNILKQCNEMKKEIQIRRLSYAKVY